MNHHRAWMFALWAMVIGVLAAGCASRPEPVTTGFLSDYSRLEKQSPARMQYVSPRLRDYTSFMVDPIEVRIPQDKLSAEEGAEAARYFRDSAIGALGKEGMTVAEAPGAGVARIKIALTDVARSTWWQKIHPLMRASGAGTGGAAMEGEIVDSVTGEQLAAGVQAVSGSQFDLTAFSTLADVKGAIDIWTGEAAARLHREHAAAPH